MRRRGPPPRPTPEHGGQRRRPGRTPRPLLDRPLQDGLNRERDPIGRQPHERPVLSGNRPEPEHASAGQRDQIPLLPPLPLRMHGLDRPDRARREHRVTGLLEDRPARAHQGHGTVEKLAGGANDGGQIPGARDAGQRAAEVSTGPVELAAPLGQHPVQRGLELD